MQEIESVLLVAVGIVSAHDTGIVHDKDAPTPVLVSVCDPIVMTKVCVKELDARFVLIVIADPKVPFVVDGCDARAIVFSVAVPDPDVALRPVVPATYPLFTTIETDFAPLASCVIVNV